MKRQLKRLYNSAVQLCNTAVSLLSVVIFSSFKCNKMINSIKHDIISADCVVLGNGPSLKECLNNHIEVLDQKDLIAVNNFCFSEYFMILKPKYYILADPQFFDCKYSNEAVNLQEDFLREIDKTNWGLFLFLPYQARKSTFVEKINKHEFIKIIYYNITPINCFSSIECWLFCHNLGMPIAQNVTCAAAFIMINLGYRCIYMLGIDHSWLKNFYVNDNNEIVFGDHHFYGNSEIKRGYSLGEWLLQLSITFNTHQRIHNYAIKKGTRIYNSTYGSYVDAYERKYIY